MESKFLLGCLAVAWGMISAGASVTSGQEGTPTPVTRPTSDTTAKAATSSMLKYPRTRRADQVDEYHGQKIEDPYRWLEELDSEETKAWVAAQSQVTSSYLEQLPARNKLRQRLTKLWNFERYGLPQKHGNRYFFARNSGLENQNAVYWTEGLQGATRLLLDPNTLSADGTVALANWVISDNGKYMAYGIATAGSDWQEWKMLEVDTGRFFSEKLQWVKFSRIAWTPDNLGFFYSRYDEPKPGEKYTGVNYYQKLYYHRLGQPQSEDKLIYERKDEKEWGFDGEVSEDGKHLIISVWKGTARKNQVFIKHLDKADSPVIELITGFDAAYEYLGHEGEQILLQTDLDAPRRRIVAITNESSDRSTWKTIVPEQNDVLEGSSIVGPHLILHYLQDAKSAVKVYSLTGELERQLELPSLGTVSGFRGKRSESETFFSFTNYTTPTSLYHYDISTGKSTIFRAPKVDFDPSKFESKQVFYTSRDGTKVPMMIVHKKGLVLDGNQPTLLYGYGGFEVSLLPSFSVSNLAWVEMGGVYAVPNLRGGGEYGQAWHDAGRHEKKQNVFDDFIAAAQWLIDNKYTNPKKLAIRGGSNGGLLVGACMTQRPDLFAAAIPQVGVMDMLRYHKFTIGWAWVSEYGSADDPEQFKTLLAYSPLHNLKPGTKYPATLITTADHDDRVVPGHSYKFAAALQACYQEEALALIRIETKAGHGAGTPTTKLIDSSADILAFLASTLEMSL